MKLTNFQRTRQLLHPVGGEELKWEEYPMYYRFQELQAMVQQEVAAKSQYMGEQLLREKADMSSAQLLYRELPKFLRALFPYDHDELGWKQMFYQYKVGNLDGNFVDFQTQFLELFDIILAITDLNHFNLGRMCLSPTQTYKLDVKSCFYRIPVQELLPFHSRRLVAQGKFSLLPNLYQNLKAESEHQRLAFQQGEILLTPWELYVMSVFKSMASAGGLYNLNIESVPQFFAFQDDPDIKVFDSLSDQQKCWYLINRYRFDFPRINTIIIARMLNQVMRRRFENYYKHYTNVATEEDLNLISPESDILILSFEEFIMNPLILGLSQMNKHFNESTTNPALYAHQDYEIEKCKDKDEYLEHMKTQHLEALYVMVEVLQRREYLFYRMNYKVMGYIQKNPTFILNHSVNYLLEMKEPLFNYLKHAFQLCPQVVSAGDLEVPYTKQKVKRNRLADFAQLWLKILQPWSQPSAFLEAATNIRLPPDKEFNAAIDKFNKGEISKGEYEAIMNKRLDLFNIYNEINDKAFNVLFHTSISDGTHSYEAEGWEDEIMEESEQREESEEEAKARTRQEQAFRDQWVPYVLEMSPFYIDLFQEYFHAINFSGNFTFEDIMILHELSQLYTAQKGRIFQDYLKGNLFYSEEIDFTFNKVLQLNGLVSMCETARRRKGRSDHFIKDSINFGAAFIEKDFWQMVERGLNRVFRDNTYQGRMSRRFEEIIKRRFIDLQIGLKQFCDPNGEKAIEYQEKLREKRGQDEQRSQRIEAIKLSGVSFSKIRQQSERFKKNLEDQYSDKLDSWIDEDEVGMGSKHSSKLDFKRLKEFNKQTGAIEKIPEDQKEEEEQSLWGSHSSGKGSLTKLKKNLFRNKSQKDNDSPKTKFPTLPKTFTKHVMGRFTRPIWEEKDVEEEEESPEDLFKALREMPGGDGMHRGDFQRVPRVIIKGKNRKDARDYYDGNEWARPWLPGESWWLYHFFRIVSFIIDKIRNDQYPDEYGRLSNHYQRRGTVMQPQSVYLRKFANVYTFLQTLIGLYLGYHLLLFILF